MCIRDSPYTVATTNDLITLGEKLKDGKTIYAKIENDIDLQGIPLVMVKKTGIVPSGLVNVKNEVKHNRAKGNKSAISIIF